MVFRLAVQVSKLKVQKMLEIVILINKDDGGILITPFFEDVAAFLSRLGKQGGGFGGGGCCCAGATPFAAGVCGN